MRKTLVMLAVLTASYCNAATWYVAANGNDNGSGSLLSPWQTLNKVNQMMSTFLPGDIIFFRRGDVFTGRLKISRSGTAINPIVFTAYGIGEKPVINGFVPLTGWTAVGMNTWEPSAALTNTYLNMVTINGVIQDKGRYPNAMAWDKGYLYYEAYSNTGSTFDTYSGTITDNELITSTNWTGADIRVRKREWVLDKGLITNQSGNVLSYTTQEGPDGPGGINMGYFIQNDPRTLDSDGEWYYNRVTKKVRLYYAGNPNNLSVLASNVDTLLSLGSSSNIWVENLAFRGSDSLGIALENSSHVTITNCSIDYSGRDGLSGNGNTYTTFVFSSIRRSNSNGIIFYTQTVNNTVYDAHNTIQFDTIEYSGTLPGLGANNNANNAGMFVAGGNTLIEGNIVRVSGYSGIQFIGDNVSVIHNIVDSFCFIKQDGAGINTYGAPNTVNKKVTGNIVSNGIGAIEGTNRKLLYGANAYYWDDLSSGIDMRNNTGFNCNGSGLFAHNNDHNTITGNLFYNNLFGISLRADELAFATGHKMRDMIVKDNFIISPLWYQLGMDVTTPYNDFELAGDLNNNHYFSIGANDIAAHQSHYSIPGWTAGYGYENTATAQSYINRPYVITAEGAAVATVTDSLIIDGTQAYPVMRIGALTNGKQYRIRFRIQGVSNARNLEVNVQRYESNDYSIISRPYFVRVDNGVTDAEIIFAPTRNEPLPVLTFTANTAITGLALPVKITGLQVQEVTADFAHATDSVRFEVNTTALVKVITLNGTYVDETGRKITGVLLLDPYKSTFLQRTEAVPAVL